MLDVSNQIIKESAFWFCAISGTCLFLIQLLSSLFGADLHPEASDGDLDTHDGEFKWLSKQALTGFLMMFGWVGLTCRKQFDLGSLPTILFSLGGGLILFFFTSLIFKGAGKLKSRGNVFSIGKTIGKTATVYQQIPPGGSGKISVVLEGLSYEIEATSSHNEILDSFTEVQIINKVDEKTVSVVPK